MKRNRKLITLRLVSALELPDWKEGYSQADLGALVGCSNNHMSHVEVGQTESFFGNASKTGIRLERTLTIFYWIPHMQNATASFDNEIAAKETEKV